MGYEFTGIKKRIPLLLSLPHTYGSYAKSALIRAGILESDIRVTPYGVRVMTDDMDTIMACRLFDKLYLTVPIRRGDRLTEESAKSTISDSMLLRIIDTYIRGERPVPVRIRVELPVEGLGKKSRHRARDEQSRLTELFSGIIESAVPGALATASSGYECELYMPGRPDGSFGMYLWCASMGDERFSYRRAVESTSMSPARAAVLHEMLHRYIIEEDSVLDPFCGTGTLLIERMKHGRCGNVFGTDISAQMIGGARANAALSSEHIHFIQRDFFDFTYDGTFDEIITELPDLYHRSDGEKRGFFSSFIKKSISITAEGAIFCVLTGDAEEFFSIVEGERGLSIEERIDFGGLREVFILRRV